MSGVSGVGSSGNMPVDPEQNISKDITDAKQALDYLQEELVSKLAGIVSELKALKDK